MSSKVAEQIYVALITASAKSIANQIMPDDDGKVDPTERKSALAFANSASFFAAAAAQKLESSIEFAERSNREYQESRRNADPSQGPKNRGKKRQVEEEDESGELEVDSTALVIPKPSTPSGPRTTSPSKVDGTETL